MNRAHQTGFTVREKAVIPNRDTPLGVRSGSVHGSPTNTQPSESVLLLVRLGPSPGRSFSRIDPASGRPGSPIYRKSRAEMQDRMQSETLCTARRKSGQPCRNYALKGGNVCRMHGGAAPQVRRAAAVRILMASDLAAARLVAMMQDKALPPVVQLAAARDLLDRAGLTSRQEIAVDFQMTKWEEAASRVVRVVEEYVQVDDDEDNQPISTSPMSAITAEPQWQEEYFPDRAVRDPITEQPAPVTESSGLVPKTREQIAARKALQKAEEHERFNERYEEMLKRRESPPKPRRLAPRKQA